MKKQKSIKLIAALSFLLVLIVGCDSAHKRTGATAREFLLNQSPTSACSSVVGYPFAVEVGVVEEGVDASTCLKLASNRLSRSTLGPPTLLFGAGFWSARCEIQGPNGKAKVTVLMTSSEGGSADSTTVEDIVIGPLINQADK